MAPRTPVPLREIVYTLSPYQQQIMGQGMSKIPRKIAHFIAEKANVVGIIGGVLFVPMWYANWYKEQEKMEDRY